MSDRDTGAADDRAPDDRETSADDAASDGSEDPSAQATDDHVGDAVSDVDLAGGESDAGDGDDADASEGGESDAEDGRDAVESGDHTTADPDEAGDGASAGEPADAPAAEGRAERREPQTVPATDGGNGDGSLGEDAAAPDVDESRVFDSLRDEYGPTDFEDIEPEVERQFPGEVDFDHLVAGDVELAEADGDEPWLSPEDPETTDAGDATTDVGDASAGDGSSVSDLVADIRSGAADEAEVEALREALQVEAPRHMDVRLRHVQSRIDDLAAYIETLETFIDEEGTPIQILKQTRDRLENLEGQIDVVKTGLVNARTERQSLEDRLTAIEDTVDPNAGAEHIEAELTQLRQRVDELADAVEDGDDATADEVADLRADLADALAERRDLRESVAAVREEQERIREVFEGIAGEFSGH